MKHHTPTNTMKHQAAGSSHRGKRQHNEDHFGIDLTNQIYVVADGMGGQSSGDWASHATVNEVLAVMGATKQRKYKDLVHTLECALWDANKKIRDVGSGMGSTVVAAIMADEQMVIAHVGDSRIYRLRQHELTLLTTDHSLYNDYLAMDMPDMPSYEDFPHKNIITRALGMIADPQAELDVLTIQSGDLYLLCSDGINNALSDAQIEAHMTDEHDLENTIENMIQEAMQSDNIDNITALLVQIE